MKIAGKIAVPIEITDFYKALNELYSRNTEKLPSIDVSDGQKQAFLDQRVPLMSFVDFAPDREKVNTIFGEVYDVILSHRPRLEEKLKKIDAELNVPNKDIRPLLEKFVWQDFKFFDDYLNERDLDEEILWLLLFHTAKPLVTEHALRLKAQVSFDKWYKNICPVCGWKPSMAVSTGENRQRVLQCSLCDTAWLFKNMECPHCLNEDHTALKYITVEDDEVYKINVCDKCKGYIKTMDDTKVLVKKSAMEEDLNTLHLDIIAEREGYQRNVDVRPKEDLN